MAKWTKNFKKCLNDRAIVLFTLVAINNAVNRLLSHQIVKIFTNLDFDIS